MANKVSPWVWVAGGCGCLIVIVLAVFVGGGLFVAQKAGDFVKEFEKNPGMAGLRGVVALHPELEMGEINEAAETVTVINTKTGEEVTFSFKDIEEGKFTILTEDGETSLDVGQEGVTVTQDGEETFSAGVGVGELPEWVPVYPDSTVSESGFASSTAEANVGARTLSSADSLESIVDWYQSKLETAGFEVVRNVTEASQGSFAILTGEDKPSGRQITVSVQPAEGGGSDVHVQFSRQRN